MDKLKEDLFILLGSFALAVGGAVSLYYVEGMKLVPAICACLAGTAGTVGMVCCLHRDWKNGTLFPKVVTAKERKQGSELRVELPYSLLSARFHELQAFEPTTTADEPPGFLGWAEGAPIHIHRTEGENWLALFWVDYDNYLRDAELTALCRRHKLPMEGAYRKMKATGVAFYREGSITLYPAAFEPEFRHHYLREFLCPKAEYREWLSSRYGEGEQE